MNLFLFIFLSLVILLFGFVLILQSYAAAQQAQAAIETARAAQIASTGQAIGTFFLGMIAMLLVVLIISVIALVVVLKLRQPAHHPSHQPQIIVLPPHTPMGADELFTRRWLSEVEEIEMPEDEETPLLPATWTW